MDQPLFSEVPDDGSDDIVRQGEDTLRRLKELEIDVKVVLDALRAGDHAARQADQFSPKTAAGIQRWTNTVQELRRGMATKGWICEDPRNSPRFIRPDHRVSIGIATGDLNTGVPEPIHGPSNAHPMGATMEESILRNLSRQVHGQAAIKEIEEFVSQEQARTLQAAPTTWILLYRRTEKYGLRSELSLPRHTVDSYISRWSERLILPEERFIDERVPLDADSEDVYFEIREA